MSDEYQSKSLGAMMDSSPENQEETKSQRPQGDEDTVTKAKEAAPKEPEVTPEGESTEPKKDSDILSELEKANKRLQDTQKWGNEKHQAYLKAQEKLHELGEITDEELAAARKGAPKTQDDMKAHVDEFFRRYEIVKDYLVTEGHEPDAIVEAFRDICGTDQAIMQEFAKTADDKKVKFVLEKGRDVLELHQGVKQYGSVAAAIAGIKKAAVDAALADVKSTKKKTDESDEEETVKAKTRLPSGGSSPSSSQYQSQSLSNLMTRK